MVVAALLFAASVAATVLGCLAMSDMGGIPMHGGWTLSMAWAPMCGQTWAGAAASFVAMWAVMMVAMMLPSVLPMLWRYRQALGARGVAGLGELTAVAGAGYFFVWTVLGIVVFALGAALAEAVVQMPALARSVPASSGLVVLIAGAFQFTARKAQHLACCRQPAEPGSRAAVDTAAAWRHGVQLGLHCCRACGGLTAILLVMGVMDLRAMAVVTAAIAAERLAPGGQRVARWVGAVAVGVGLVTTVRALL
jgi:predicted metal-binding membrane protein